MSSSPSKEIRKIGKYLRESIELYQVLRITYLIDVSAHLSFHLAVVENKKEGANVKVFNSVVKRYYSCLSRTADSITLSLKKKFELIIPEISNFIYIMISLKRPLIFFENWNEIKILLKPFSNGKSNINLMIPSSKDYSTQIKELKEQCVTLNNKITELTSKVNELEDEKAKNGGNFTNKVEDLLSNIYIEVGKIGDKTAKLDAIEDKLGKLDAIEDKLSAIEKNTSKLDTIASDVESMKKTSESVLVKLNEIDENVLDCTNTIVALSPQHKKQP